MPPSLSARSELPPWERLLVVVAHPDDESFGLGAVLERFTAEGARVTVLCLTEGEASTLGSGAELRLERRAELAAASRALGVSATHVHHHPDGALSRVCRQVLAGEVVDEIRRTGAQGLLAFDDTGVTGHPDHAAATAAALAAGELLDVPVLAWTLPRAVADQLNDELAATGFSGRESGEIDLVVQVDRTRQVAASKAHRSQAVPTSPLWRRLDLLGDREHLRWLRRPAVSI